MFDDIPTHFHQGVLAPYKDYLAARDEPSTGQSRDLRLGLEAAKALYHFREHLPPSHAKERDEIVKVCPDYKLLADVVDAAKHGTLQNPNRQLRTASDIFETTVITDFRDTAGSYRHVEKEVTIRLKGGVERSLCDVLESVANYWIDELARLGLTAKYPHFAASKRTFPLTRSQCDVAQDGTPRLDTTIIQGLRYSQRLRLQRFNYATGVVEPIDLTGAQVKMRIYRPPTHSVDLEVTNPAGKVFKRTVEITGDEAAALEKCPTDEEKGKFVENSLTVRRAFEELLKTATDNS